MPLLSVAIITCDEERNLARTLASVSFADEVIVVDSGSKDRTVEIAEAFGAKIFVREWPGFAAQKNFAISQCKGDWVLSLDADEEMSPELATQIRLFLLRLGNTRLGAVAVDPSLEKDFACEDFIVAIRQTAAADKMLQRAA